MTQSRRCSKCRIQQPLTEFPGKRNYLCKACTRNWMNQPIMVACPVCGKEREVRRANKAVHERCACRACATKARLKEVTESKACNQCGVVKHLAEFWRANGQRDGRQSICRDCSNKRSSKPTTVTCPSCGDERTVAAGYANEARKRLCRSCAHHAYREEITLTKGGAQGYCVKFEIRGRRRFRYFPTRAEASRFRNGLTQAAAPAHANDKVGEAYALIRKTLATLGAGGLSIHEEDQVMGPLYEAEDALAVILRAGSSLKRAA